MYVYMLTNNIRTVLYIGVTNDLARRLAEHGDTLVTLQTIDTVYVDFYVPQKQVAGLSVGQKLKLTSDGYPGVSFDAFCDLLNCTGAFSEEEASEYLKAGTLNGLFVLGRSIGFIGHFLDQKLLKQPLYRHPSDDFYINFADHSRVVVQPKK